MTWNKVFMIRYDDKSMCILFMYTSYTLPQNIEISKHTQKGKQLKSSFKKCMSQLGLYFIFSLNQSI